MTLAARLAHDRGTRWWRRATSIRGEHGIPGDLGSAPALLPHQRAGRLESEANLNDIGQRREKESGMMFDWLRGRGSGKRAEPTAAAPKGKADAYVATLARVPLFVDLSQRELQRLAAACAEREYAAGDVLVRQGDPGAGLFVIESGRVRVMRHEEGSARELSVMGPGEVFGEMALLDEYPRSATVTAIEPTRVILLPVFDFRAALHEDGDISIRLLAVISRRLRRAEQHHL
jgi:CRP/FNR family transcriptional regulator, cyclic AMP receptor protein